MPASAAVPTVRGVIARAWLPALLLVSAAGLWMVAAEIPAPGLQPGQLPPWAWPRGILLGLMVSCAVKILHGYREVRVVGDATVAAVKTSETQNLSVLSAAILLIVGQVVLAEFVGFLAATFAFLIAFVYLAGWRRPLPLVALAGVSTIAVVYVFVKIVYMPLPKGAGVFEDVTVALYRLLRIY